MKLIKDNLAETGPHFLINLIVILEEISDCFSQQDICLPNLEPFVIFQVNNMVDYIINRTFAVDSKKSCL